MNSKSLALLAKGLRKSNNIYLHDDVLRLILDEYFMNTSNTTDPIYCSLLLSYCKLRGQNVERIIKSGKEG